MTAPRPIVDISETAMREAARKVTAARPGVEPQTALAVIQVLLVLGWRPEPSACERMALCSSCCAPLSCQPCGGKRSTCSDAQCDIHRPCSCGEAECHWNGAGEVIHALGWHDTPKPKLSRPAGTGERLSKPWTV